MSKHEGTDFRKSRHCSMEEDCVEIGRNGPVVKVRDSKAQDAGTLDFSVTEIRRFFAEVRAH